MREIDAISSFDHEVDLLIGQDYACCFIPLDVLKGQQDEPYAVKTPLGYVIHGANSDNQCYNSTVSHSISTLMTACCTDKLRDECDIKMSHENTPDKRHGPEPRAYLRGGFKPPPKFSDFFLKSEGKEIESKRKKGMLGGGGGLPLNIFLGLIFF